MSATPTGEMSTPQQGIEDDRLLERRREAVVLVMRFLVDCGFQNAYKSLCAESAISLAKVDAADNIDLLTILQEFRDYYQAKFGRFPKLVRPTHVDYQPSFHGGMSSGMGNMPAPRPHSLLALQDYKSADQHLPMVDMSSPTSPLTDCNIPSTCRIGGSEPLNQLQFMSLMMSHPTATPTQLLTFTAPKRDTFKRRSAILNLSDMQEDTLYALVGCVGVGWSMRNVTPEMKEFLRSRFDISKDLLQTFFKNRAQKKRKGGSDHHPQPHPSSRFALSSPMQHEMPASPQGSPMLPSGETSSAAAAASAAASAAAAAAAANQQHSQQQHHHHHHHHHQQVHASSQQEQQQQQQQHAHEQQQQHMHSQVQPQAQTSTQQQQQQHGHMPPEMGSAQHTAAGPLGPGLAATSPRLLIHQQNLAKQSTPHAIQNLGLQMSAHAQQLLSQQ